MEDNRKKALVAALGQIEKQFGKGSVMRLGDGGATYDVEAIATGSLGLDIALGVGGLPRGRVVEIYGPESLGQDDRLPSTSIAEVQSAGGTERRLRRRRARARSGVRRKPRRSTSGPARSRSRTTASRRSKSSRRWCSPAALD